MKNNQTGRSMVEMLGVLAIIGILSAGALAGYSKAMFRHKANQTIDTFATVLQRFVELEHTGWGKGVEITDADALVKYNLLPDCLRTENDGCQLPLGTLYIDFEDKGSYIRGEFMVDFTDSKSCIAFASAGWENAVPVEWWGHPEDEDLGGFIEVYKGEDRIIYNLGHQHYDIIDKVTMENITNACAPCDEEGECLWYFVVRSEL